MKGLWSSKQFKTSRSSWVKIIHLFTSKTHETAQMKNKMPWEHTYSCLILTHNHSHIQGIRRFHMYECACVWVWEWGSERKRERYDAKTATYCKPNLLLLSLYTHSTSRHEHTHFSADTTLPHPYQNTYIILVAYMYSNGWQGPIIQQAKKPRNYKHVIQSGDIQ